MTDPQASPKGATAVRLAARNNPSLPFRVANFETLTEGLDYAAQGETGYNFFSGRGQPTAALSYRELRALALDVAERENITLRQGVYAWFNGPCYETPAEIRMARVLGADAVGMSTVPETIVAVHSGLRVLGVSCLTNMAAGILDQPLSHQEVVETGAKARASFRRLLDGVVQGMEL